MSEEPHIAEETTLSKWQEHKFLMLIVLTIAVSIFLVGIALALYNSSGAAQLDLSGPRFQSVQKQAVQDDDFNGFPSSGELDQAAFNQFSSEYDKQTKKVTAVDSFGGDVMSDQALSIDPPTDE